MHIPDVFVLKPIFHEGRRLAFAATICHQTDMGGRVAGSNASDSTEIYQEGPPHPARRACTPRASRTRRSSRSSRRTCALPVRVFGDLRAQLSACHIAEEAFLRLVARHGPDTCRATWRRSSTTRSGSRAPRSAELPDGQWSFEDWIDDDGIDFGRPIPLKVTLTKTRRPPHRGLDGIVAAGQGRHQQHVLVHARGDVLLREVGAAPRDPEQRGLLSVHRGDRAARHHRQWRAARRLRGARPHRLSDGRLLLRRAGPDAARPRDGRLRGRQHRRVHRRLLSRTGGRSSSWSSSARRGAAGRGPTASRATRTSSPTCRCPPRR